MSDQEEIWKLIPNFERYEVSNLGRVRRLETQRIKKVHINSRTGYSQLSLRKKGSLKSYTLNLYRLVYESFNGPVPENFEVDHIDRNRTNTNLNNLRVCSKSQNIHRSKRNNPRGYTGVFQHRATPNRYWARVMKDGKNHHLGTFDTAKEAAIAYNQKALELFGEFANLNSVD